jgi:hypothetical protein
MPDTASRNVQWVSEAIVPLYGTFYVARMGRGEPGLPAGFTWRGRSFAVVAELASW